MAPRVQIQKLRSDAVVPRYMSAQAAGLDLHAAIDAPITITPGKRTAIGTGLAFAFILVLLGSVVIRSSREEGSNSAQQTTSNEGSEPLAELGVAPGATTNNSSAAKK